jgi:hypothetical protein
MARRQYLPPLGQSLRWHVTVIAKDASDVVAHTLCEDEKECQAVATLARSKNLAHRIVIRSPFGKVYDWA